MGGKGSDKNREGGRATGAMASRTSLNVGFVVVSWGLVSSLEGRG